MSYFPHTDNPRPLPPTWEPLWDSFALHMNSTKANRSGRTLISYRDSASMFARFLAERGEVPALAEITRHHVEGFLAHVLANRKPATANMRYRGLKRFLNWLADEDEVPASIFTKANGKPAILAPRFELDPPQVLNPSELSRLLKVCEGKGFEARRDMAILRFLMDTGARRGEVAGLRLADIDLARREAHVDGKGGKRTVQIGAKAAAALDRYLRARASHKGAPDPALWLGTKGQLSGDGIFQMVERRATQAGLKGRVYVHLFRHTFTHMWLLDGGEEGDLMRLNGWKSRAMLDRYAAGSQGERARAAHAIHGPGDKIG